MATQGIRKGEKLLEVPDELLLTADAAARQSAIASQLLQDGFPTWSVLAAFLAEVRRSPAEAGNAWAPFVSALPSSCGCVLEWSRDEVRDLSESVCPSKGPADWMGDIVSQRLSRVH